LRNPTVTVLLRQQAVTEQSADHQRQVAAHERPESATNGGNATGYWEDS